MFCGINLQQEKCNCDLSNVPDRSNRTDTVKYAFTRIFNPNWIKEKVDFVQRKIEYYNYLLSSEEYFNLILLNTYNLTIPTSDTSDPEEKYWKSNEKGYSEKNYDDDGFLSDYEIEFEYTYGVFIKLENGMSLPAKWYTTKVFTVDELLLEIHLNVETLTGKSPIEPNNYRVAFKSEKAAGVGTQLVDTQDFKNLNLITKNINLKAFFITFNPNIKRKLNDLGSDNSSDDEIIKYSRNKNSIPKTSSLSSAKLSIARNVLEIRKENHCAIHNRPCLNKDGAKEIISKLHL
ncbi:25031_t:CDS:2 [Dentiscutata erythropus]|uniref:25031_t:CDS:1 n=1 Tax=Dentiscutata erythropus TaxID=1348616 RepID=A0A9N9BCL3_9GLOM|nr:25031_t:CDS:2 [Dentiscutata erythropus]